MAGGIGGGRERDWHARAQRETTAEIAQARAEKEALLESRKVICAAQLLVDDDILSNGMQELDEMFAAAAQPPHGVKPSCIQGVPLGPDGELGTVPWIRPSLICKILEKNLQANSLAYSHRARETTLLHLHVEWCDC